MSLWWAAVVLVIIAGAAGVSGEAWLMFGIVWLIIAIVFVAVFGKAGKNAHTVGRAVTDALKKEKELVETATPRVPGREELSEVAHDLGKFVAEETLTTAEQRAQIKKRKLGERLSTGSQRVLERLKKWMNG